MPSANRLTIMKIFTVYLGPKQQANTLVINANEYTRIPCYGADSLGSQTDVVIHPHNKNEDDTMAINCDVDPFVFNHDLLITIANTVFCYGGTKAYINNKGQVIQLNIVLTEEPGPMIQNVPIEENTILFNDQYLHHIDNQRRLIAAGIKAGNGPTAPQGPGFMIPVACGHSLYLNSTSVTPDKCLTITTDFNPLSLTENEREKTLDLAQRLGAIKVIIESTLGQLTLIADFTNSAIEKGMSRLYRGRNNMPLLTQTVEEDYDQLTVVNYEKWYDLYILRSDGTVDVVDTDVMSELIGEGYEYVDHTPHPMFMAALAKRLNVQLPATVLEVVAGRWAIDNTGTYYDYDLYGVEDDDLSDTIAPSTGEE